MFRSRFVFLMAFAGAWLLLAERAGAVDKVPFSGDVGLTPTLITTHAVELGDFDRDGDLDAVAAAQNSSTVAWLENRNGNGTLWLRRNIVTDLTNAFSVTPLDADMDGDLDVVAGGQDGLFWFENDGTPADGLWTRRTITDDFSLILSVCVVDIDGDGVLDVAATAFNSNAVFWCRNDGTPSNDASWVTTVIDGDAGDARTVKAADIDCDGDPDIAVATLNDDALTWYENVGAPGPGNSWTRRTVVTLTGIRVSAVGDIDRDGDIDIVGASGTAKTVAWWENVNGDGSSWTRRDIDLTAPDPASLHVVDLDQDGDLDVISGSIVPFNSDPTDDVVVWFENIGSPGDGLTWNKATIDQNIDRAEWVTAGDMDRDGDIDVVGVQNGAGTGASEADVVMWRNQSIHGNASFARQHTVESAFNGARAVAVGDVDLDGNMDIVGAARDGGSVRWWRSDGTPQDDLGGDGNSWTEIPINNSFGGATSVVVADVDRDCAPDVIAAAFTANRVTWFQNSDGLGGAWNPVNISSTFSNPTSAYPVDVDQDGDLDVLATSSGASDVVWFENTNGAGTAWTQRAIDLNLGGASGVAAGDFNRDGAVDVVASGATSNTIVYYRGNGGASWTPVTVTTGFNGASSVAVADIDRDGDLDIAATSETGNEVAVFRNGSNGATWTKVIAASGQTGARSVSAVDFDYDGDPDLVAAVSGLNRIVYLENATGNGLTWNSVAVDSSLGGASGVAIGDLDGNGLMDVAAAGDVADAIRWYENLGGQFSFGTTNLSSGVILQGSTGAVLRVVAKHNGRSGDSDAEVASFELLFEATDGDPLSSGEANALIQDLHIFLDANGNNTFEQASDTLVTTVGTLSLSSGVQTITFTDAAANTRVAQATPKTYFVVAALTANASSQNPKTFQITHVTEASSKAEDFTTDSPLRIEFAANAASANTLAGNLTAPQVSSAAATSPTAVTVTFSKAMQNDAALTNPGNYTFTGGLVAQSVARTSATTVSVTTTEMQQGTSYTVTVSTTGPRDLEGNFVQAGANTANFTGVGTPPEVVSATAIDSTTVRVVFSKAMSNNAALVTVGNYELLKSGSPEIDKFNPLSVSRLNSTTVDLTITEMQDGINYTVTVSTSGPIDLAGNFVASGANTDTFAGIGIKPTVLSATATSTTTVRVVFSEAMANNAALTTAGNYTFDNGLSAVTATRFSATTVDITTGSITADQTYTVTVLTPGGPTDVAGNVVASGSNTASFVGIGGNPQVTSAEALSATVVRITFSEEMQNLTTFGDYSFSNGLTAQSAVAALGNTAVDVTVNEMTQGQSYTATVSTSGPQDTSNNFVSASANTADFTGIGDGPGVLSATATGSTTVRVVFDEPMLNDPALVSAGNYTFNNGLVCSGATRINGTTVDLATSEMLQGQSYTVTVSTTGPKDALGNFVDAGDNSAAFSGVGTPPRVLSASALDSTRVQIVFNEAMLNNAALTTAGNYTFNNGLIAQSVSRSNATTVVVTTTAMTGGTNYTATVSTAAGGPKDLAGNTVAVGFNTAQFTGIGGNPQVASASAINSTTVEVVFSESMTNDSELIDINNYTFNNSLVSNAVLRVNATTVRITTSEMRDGLGYTLTVSTSGPTDLDGNPLSASGNTASFSGIGTLPSVVSAGATSTTTVRLVFSEAMTNNGALTNAANYSFNNGLTASSVARINPTTVDITTSTIDGGTSYTVTVTSSVSTGPVDLAGNPVSPSLNTANFSGIGSSPQVVQAIPNNSTSVRVTFSEAMQPNAALITAGNYVFDNGLTAVSVSVFDATRVDVTTTEMVTDVLYTLSVATSGIVDLDNGNTIPVNANTAVFLGAGSAPVVQSASAVGSTTVEVNFNEAMADDAALTSLGNYTFTGGLEPLAVVRVDADTIQIAVVEMLDGQPYTLTVSSSGPTDIAGNPVSTLGNQDTFAGTGEPPVITLIGESTVTVDLGGAYEDAGAVATDNFDGDLTPDLQVTSNVNTNAAGTYSVTYNVSDAAGNAATPAVRTVIVTVVITVFGDLNGDDVVNAVDVQLVINDALGIDISPFSGDVNGDDAVNAVDVQLVINAALGL